MNAGFYNFFSRIAIFAVALCIISMPLAAQETVSNTQVSEKAIKAQIQDVQADTTLDETEREQLIENYHAALGYIATAQDDSSKADAFASSLTASQQETTLNQKKISDGQADAASVLTDLPAAASSREIELQLQSERVRESAESTKLAGLVQQLNAETDRTEIARQTIQSTRQTLEQLPAPAKATEPGDESSLLTESTRWKALTQAAALNAEINMLEQELLSQPSRVELLMTQRDLSALIVKQNSARTLLLEQALAEARKRETEKIIEASSASELTQHPNNPVIIAIIAQNQALSQKLQALTVDLEKNQSATRLVNSDLKEIKQSFQTARQRLKIAGLNKALGQVLHEQRRDLPKSDQYRSSARKLEEKITDAGLQDIKFSTEWRELRDTPTYIAKRLSGLSPAQQKALTPPLKDLVEKRRVLLKNTRAANSNYLRALTELNFLLGQAQQTTAEFDAFLVEHLLWVRNKKTVSFASLRVVPGELINILAPQPWLESVRALFSSNRLAKWFWLAVLSALLLLWKKKLLLTRLLTTAKPVGIPSKDSMTYSWRAVGITFLLALPWPVLTFAVGWDLSHRYELSEAAQTIGKSLQAVTLALFYQRALCYLCTSGGLAEGHFKWPVSLVRQLAKYARLILVSFLLPIFIMILAVRTYPETFGGEVGRISFVLAIIGIGIFLVGILKPHTGSFAKLNTQRGYANRFSWLWLIMGAAIPFVFAIMALAGYQYSAITLMVKLIQSLWLAFGLMIARELVRRWLLVLSGRLNLEAFRERREAFRLAREREMSQDPDHETVALAPEEPPVDVASVSVETGKLVSFVLLLMAFIGLRGIWASVLPALSIFKEITLWEFAEGVSGQEHMVAVTLADFMLAVVYLLITFFAARSIPSLLKAVLRYSSSITLGSRVAFATLARYSIVIIGIVMVTNTIGWNWGKIQWLIAAMGVGIGFGLQEIIANFISGIIILVERPIRVGDLVTVGDASGTVSRLQIRATTIVNFDRQELLVPNKEFITGRVLNWSLSDEIIRLKIRVGVAYGSDIDKALDLVRDVVRNHPLILTEPPPLITFTEFGDNSLNITARSFTNSLSKRRETISDLNLGINEKFTQAGIVIAFPQRDVHLNTTTPLEIRVQKDPAQTE